MAAGIDGIADIIKLVGGPSAVAALGWWLRGKFGDIREAGALSMRNHELQDERRHRQNLVRFAKLNTKLGIPDADESNGSHDE